MAFRKATLRRMPPVTRKYARLLNELDSVLRRGKNMVEEIQRLELDSRALAHAKEKASPEEELQQ
ncbi:unnamed protein product [marine sediment metagenome]|uniref:V-type ATP synthase subunit D n=1 Tax=marine sediment metagenome TaxID=412755 RepID=X1U4S0_9ZZZZ